MDLVTGEGEKHWICDLDQNMKMRLRFCGMTATPSVPEVRVEPVPPATAAPTGALAGRSVVALPPDNDGVTTQSNRIVTLSVVVGVSAMIWGGIGIAIWGISGSTDYLATYGKVASVGGVGGGIVHIISGLCLKRFAPKRTLEEDIEFQSRLVNATHALGGQIHDSGVQIGEDTTRLRQVNSDLDKTLEQERAMIVDFNRSLGSASDETTRLCGIAERVKTTVDSLGPLPSQIKDTLSTTASLIDRLVALKKNEQHLNEARAEQVKRMQEVQREQSSSLSATSTLQTQMSQISQEITQAHQQHFAQIQKLAQDIETGLTALANETATLVRDKAAMVKVLDGLRGRLKVKSDQLFRLRDAAAQVIKGTESFVPPKNRTLPRGMNG